MAVNMSALSQMQIVTFFRRNDSVTQKQCNDKAESMAGELVSPTACQGGTSYTVYAGQVVVQFRVPGSLLDMNFIKSIEKAYQGFTPQHMDCGQLANLHVYKMNNIGGISMYLARENLQGNNYELLRNTINDYARFVNITTRPTPTLTSDSHLPMQGIVPTTDLTGIDSLPQRILIRLGR